ncbi:helix-turn-helix transcriptional regulator [Sphingobium sp. AS12]|nr:helix-turn-helix transcriptional regulator [Sphingobium sp. AS12]MBV2149990.1 helix-turn-helix transcriptional regulator [Sphingobium sp. AS12]
MRAMRADTVSIRCLSTRAGINKSRIGKLLHRDPKRRSSISFDELQRILAALDIDLLEAIICVETVRDLDLLYSARYATLIPMLCAMFRELPMHLIAALEEVDGVDGTEVRPEWAGVLQRSVIQRIIKGMSDTALRRAALAELQE